MWMMYSTAIFKTEDEDLNTAQLRKISILIDKGLLLFINSVMLVFYHMNCLSFFSSVSWSLQFPILLHSLVELDYVVNFTRSCGRELQASVLGQKRDTLFCFCFLGLLFVWVVNRLLLYLFFYIEKAPMALIPNFLVFGVIFVSR